MHTDVVKTKPTKLSVYTTLFVQMFFGKYRGWKFGKFSIVSFWGCRKETYSQVINKCFHMFISICNIIVETVYMHRHIYTNVNDYFLSVWNKALPPLEKCWITDRLCGLNLINFELLSCEQILYNEEELIQEINCSHFIIHAL